MIDPRPRRANLLVIGQSHVAAIRAAAKIHREAFPDQPRTRVIHTREEVHAPEFAEPAAEPDHAPRFGPKLTAAIEDQIRRHRPRIASVVGGNAHNALALMRHPRPFDFMLAGGDGPPLDSGSELIPEALVRESLRQRLAGDFARLHALRAIVGSFLHVESPPPVGDPVFIEARAEAWFREHATAVKAAGRGVRWRMWRLTSHLLRAEVEAIGCTWLPAPGEVADADGFLRTVYAADPTHGNAAYGELLIRAIEDA